MTDLAEIEARWDSWATMSLVPSQPAQDIAYLIARVRELEAGLQRYGQHKPRCYAAPLGISRGRHDPPCTCGLTALATE